MSPILILLLSVFSTGSSIVKKQYENQKKQAEKSLKDSIKSSDDIDEKKIKTSLKKLRRIKRIADDNLFYLNAKMQIISIMLPLLISFIFIIIAIISYDSYPKFYWWIVLSSILFMGVLYSLWKLMLLLIIVRQAEHNDEVERQKTMIKTLNNLLDISGGNILEKIWVSIDDVDLKNLDKPIELELHKETSVRFAIINEEDKMIKTIELGVRFPSNFIVPHSDFHRMYRTDTEQIIRYEADRIHADTNYHFRDLKFTPTNTGKYDIEVFVNGENIKSYNSIISFEVVEPAKIEKNR